MIRTINKTFFKSFTRKKSLDFGENTTEGFTRVLGMRDLIVIGIGCIVGSGLFSITGVASNMAGPAVLLSFLLASITCSLTGLCYSELTSMVPISGSAYTYASIIFGEFIAWIIGWNLVLEYALATSVISVSWSQYAISALPIYWLDILPPRLLASPLEVISLSDGSHIRGWINLPPVLLLVCATILVIHGIKISSITNNILVTLKILIIILFIIICFPYVKTNNFHPFLPANTGVYGHFGWSGVLMASGVIFFSYLGFDVISTVSQETKNPTKTIPWAILICIIISTILYVSFSYILLGLVPFSTLANNSAPVATALQFVGVKWLESFVKTSIIIGFFSAVIIMLTAQSRIFFTMSHDGLLPAFFSNMHPKWITPWKGNIIVLVITALTSAYFPIEILAKLTSFGTLTAFFIVCSGVIVLRIREPNRHRNFKVPFGLTIPILALCCNSIMIYSLDSLTWLRALIWIVVGIMIYFFYGYSHSKIHENETSIRNLK